MRHYVGLIKCNYDTNATLISETTPTQPLVMPPRQSACHWAIKYATERTKNATNKRHGGRDIEREREKEEEREERERVEG